MTSVFSFERSRHAYMALYVRTPWLSVNSWRDMARSGTWYARRQFWDCPGHSGTIGYPTTPSDIERKEMRRNSQRYFGMLKILAMSQ